jgi:hypothetical protein
MRWVINEQLRKEMCLLLHNLSSPDCAFNMKHLLNFQINLSDPASTWPAILATAAIFLYRNIKLALKEKRFNYFRDIQRGVPNLLKWVSLLVFIAVFIDPHKESQLCVDL